jgi:Tol biopolymer transport system component
MKEIGDNVMQISRLTPSALGTCALIAVLAGCNSAGSQQLPPVGPVQTNVGSDADRAPAKSGPDAFPGKNGRIAFLYGLSFGGDVYTMNSDGSHIRRVTRFGPSFATAVDWVNWSPDGRHFVFDEFSKAKDYGDDHVWLMNADGSDQHPLLSHAHFIHFTPSFSPSGDQVIFARAKVVSVGGLYRTGASAIYRANVDGTGLTAITSFADKRNDDKPVYSPDGSTIALNSAHLGGYNFPLALMNADGSGIQPITPTALGATAANWSPDGRRLVFSTYIHDVLGSNEEIWTSDARGGDLQRLTKNNFPGQRSYFAEPHDFNPSWSPRGDAIVFERWNGPYTSWGIYVLTGNGAARTTKRLLAGDSLGPARPPVFGAHQIRGRNDAALQQINIGGTVPRWGSAPDKHGPNGKS